MATLASLSASYDSATGTPDDAMTLTQGNMPILTVLDADFDIGDEECTLLDASGTPGRGAFVVEDEIVYYGHRIGNAPCVLEDLLRGQAGTTEADHASGASVYFYPAPIFNNPIQVDATIKMQEDIIALRAMLFTTALTPAQITANTNNYSPTGMATASSLRLDTDASRNLTGIATGLAGRILFIHNIGGFDLVLKNEDAGSSTDNRFALPADITIPSKGSVSLQYDGTSARWRCTGKNF